MDRDPQDRHETAVGVRYNDAESRRWEGSLVEDRPLWGPHHVPDTEYEALMECAPFEEPKVSQETIETQESIVLTLPLQAKLTPIETAVIDMIVYGEKSLSQVGAELGREFRSDGTPYSKRYVSLQRDSALRKMREVLCPPCSPMDTSLPRSQG